MNYILVALLVSVLTVFVTPVAYGLFAKKEINFWAHSLGAIIYFFALWLTMWRSGAGFISPLPLDTPVLVGLLIGFIVGLKWDCGEPDLDLGTYKVNFILLITGLVVVVIVSISGSDMFHATKKSELIGKVEVVKDLNSAFTPADPSHICLVSEDMALIKAQDALSKFKLEGDVIPGSRFSVGRATKQFVDGQLWWNFPLEFQGYFKWKQDKIIPGYLRVSAEDPKAEPQAVQIDKNGKTIAIKYSTSACYEYAAKRWLRHNGFASKILEDWTFETDDQWRPYYTVSIMERTIGYGAETFLGLAVLDMQSGEITYVKKDDLHKAEWDWIDRGIPLDNLDYQLGKWGQYSKSDFWYTFWHDDKSQQTTPGWYLTYDGDKCRWFSGWTSKSSGDQALTGFSLSDGKTGETKFFKANGVTEIIAKATAVSLWKNFDGYETTELVPYNIYGTITYVCPITYQGQFKGVSLVSLNNKDINAKGNDLSEALANYRAALLNTGGRYAPNGQESKLVVLSGTVSSIGKTLQLGQSQLFPFMLKGVKKSFTANYNEKTREIPYLEVGQTIRMTYLDTKEPVIQVETLDIFGISFTDENPEQAKFLENQATVKKETDRISQEEKKATLIESDALKDVPAEELQKFLEEQKSKKK